MSKFKQKFLKEALSKASHNRVPAVYIMVEQQHFKIGYSKDVQTRIPKVVPELIKEKSFILLFDYDASAIRCERILLSMFSKHHADVSLRDGATEFFKLDCLMNVENFVLTMKDELDYNHILRGENLFGPVLEKSPSVIVSDEQNVLEVRKNELTNSNTKKKLDSLSLSISAKKRGVVLKEALQALWGNGCVLGRFCLAGSLDKLVLRIRNQDEQWAFDDFQELAFCGLSGCMTHLFGVCRGVQVDQNFSHQEREWFNLSVSDKILLLDIPSPDITSKQWLNDLEEYFNYIVRIPTVDITLAEKLEKLFTEAWDKSLLPKSAPFYYKDAPLIEEEQIKEGDFLDRLELLKTLQHESATTKITNEKDAYRCLQAEHFIQSSLFASIQGKDRLLIEDQVIGNTGDLEIRFTGYQLEQADFTVWLMLKILADASSDRTFCRFKPNAFLSSLGLSNGKADYVWLNEVFMRLCNASIKIQTGDKFLSGNLLSSFHKDTVTGDHVLRLEPVLTHMVTSNIWTPDLWLERLKLKRKPLALWLHALAGCSIGRHAFSIPTILALCHSGNTNLRDFRRKIRAAIQEINKISRIKFLYTQRALSYEKLEPLDAAAGRFNSLSERQPRLQ